MIRKLGHLGLLTDNLTRLHDFYTGSLGFAVKFPFINAEGETFGYYLECGDSTFVEIFDRVLKYKQWGGTPYELRGGGSCDHFCFEITDLPAFKATLESRGLKLTDIRSGMDHSLQSWTQDPDGNRIEFMQFTGRSLQLLGGVASDAKS